MPRTLRGKVTNRNGVPDPNYTRITDDTPKEVGNFDFLAGAKKLFIKINTTEAHHKGWTQKVEKHQRSHDTKPEKTPSPETTSKINVCLRSLFVILE